MSVAALIFLMRVASVFALIFIGLQGRIRRGVTSGDDVKVHVAHALIAVVSLLWIRSLFAHPLARSERSIYPVDGMFFTIPSLINRISS